MRLGFSGECMEERLFGSSGRRVAVIGQGTWNLEQASAALAVRALRRGFDLGMTHVDCAEMYGSGQAEELVAQAISGRRDEIFLVSKVLPSHASKIGVQSACEASLARLKTDRLDCYLLHWRGRIPLGETLAGFEQLQREGKILSWGVSNFDVSDLEEVTELAGGRPPACNQVLYHLDERAIEHTVIPWCEKHGVAVVAYSPFGHQGLPRPADRAGQGPAGDRRGARGDCPRGGAGLSRGEIPSSSLSRRLPTRSTPPRMRRRVTSGSSAAELARIRDAFPLDPHARALPTL